MFPFVAAPVFIDAPISPDSDESRSMRNFAALMRDFAMSLDVPIPSWAAEWKVGSPQARSRSTCTSQRMSWMRLQAGVWPITRSQTSATACLLLDLT